MTQIGVLLFYVLPFALKAGRCSLIAIPLAALYCVVAKRLFYQRQSFIWNWMKLFLAIILGIFLLYNLSVLGMEYIYSKKFWPILTLILLGLLILGRRKNEEGYVIPGKEGLLSLWSKIVIVMMLVILCFQIPNINFEYGWSLKGVQFIKVISYSALFFFMDIPFFLGIGREEAEKKKSCLMVVCVWMIFYLTYLVMSCVFQYQVTEQMEVAFLSLGRSAIGVGKQPMRLEIPTVSILWAGMFFSLWECANVIFESVRRKK